jgi:TrpR-related protein YerC/YecD
MANPKPLDTTKLFAAILTLKTAEECEQFFRDILTKRELAEMIKRFSVAEILNQPHPPSYLEIAQKIGTSTTTVTRVAQWLNSGEDGYQLVFKRLKK